MENLYISIISLEMLFINLYTAYICLKRKYSAFTTWSVFLAFTVVIMTTVTPLLRKFPSYGRGSGLFICIGFLYIIPLKFLFHQSIKYTLTVMCSVWIYTMFSFSLSIQAGSFITGPQNRLFVVIFQTAFYLLTFPFFFKLIKNKLVYILQNVDDKTLNSLLKLSLSWFLFILFLNVSFTMGNPPVMKIIVFIFLAINSLLSYHLFYSLVFMNKTAEKLDERTKRDILTKLRNREGFIEDAQKMMNKDIPFSIIFIDLDDFKTVNDIHGHSVGDEYLVRFSQTVKGAVGKKGHLYRISGDEFIFLYEGHDVDSFAQSLKHIRFTRSKNLIEFKGLSIGCSSFPKDGRNLNDLLRLADFNMYQEKKKKHRMSAEIS